jgi:hypothetical protein
MGIKWEAMRKVLAKLIFAVLLALLPFPLHGQSDARAQQIFTLTNQDRQEHGLQQLHWSESLASAAGAHANLMVQQSSLSHQYSGEPDLTARAAQAGAHFQAIAENVATGPGPDAIEHEWMNSTAHRTNILDPKMNQIGIAVVERHGTLYAVEDFADGVETLSAAQVERKVGDLLRAQNIQAVGASDPLTAQAKQACSANQGIPAGARFAIRFQTSDLSQLPSQAGEQIATGKYTKAAVGACTPSGSQGSFTVYRVAILFY